MAEVALRLMYPDKVNDFKASNLMDSAYVFNEDYLVSLKPNATGTFVRSKEDGGDVIRWQTNSDSFRGPELLSDPEYRIIIYGDSNIQARFSSYENTFVYKLGEYLREYDIKDLEVVNAGVIGFGPDQSLIRFEKEADIYHPDLVIFHIFPGNDFGDIIRNRLFELDPDGNLIKTNYKTAVDEYLFSGSSDTWRDFLSSLLIVRATKKLLRSIEDDKTKFNEKTIDKYLRLCNDEYSIYKQSQPRKYSHFADHPDADLELTPSAESSKVKVRLMEEVLKKANQLGNSHGIEFLVVIKPFVLDVIKNNIFLSSKYLERFPEYRKTNLTDAVERICRSNNIDYVNLFDVFYKNSPQNLFFAGDDHWNDLGQDIAAREVALYLRNKITYEYMLKSGKEN